MSPRRLLLVFCVVAACSLLPTNGQIRRLQPGNQHEICLGETVTLSCPSANHMPLVRAARYGRMNAHSQCLQTRIRYGYDRGLIGCASDVTSHLKQRCIERKDCSIQLPDDFTEIRPCDDVMYLELRYDCTEDRSGIPTTYTITTSKDNYRHQYEYLPTNTSAYIILFGESGSRLTLLLDKLTQKNSENIYGQERYGGPYVFENVTSVGTIRCVDFQVIGSGQEQFWPVSSVSIQNTESVSFSVNAYYTTDSVYWPATRGCGTPYTIHLVFSNPFGQQYYQYNEQRSYTKTFIYVTLIGDEGNSSQLVLGKGDANGYTQNGNLIHQTYSFNNLPPIGRVSCVHIRRDDWPDNSRSYSQDETVDYVSLYLVSIRVINKTGESFINVSSWIPSKSQLPNGIVVCGNGSTLCLSDLEASCPMPPFLKELQSLSTLEQIQKLVDTNMLSVCPAVESFFNCTTSFLKVNSQCPEQQQIDKAERLRIQMLAALIENVCGSNLDVINCHKKCLLQKTNDGKLIVTHAIRELCSDDTSADNATDHFSLPLCKSHEFVNCAADVVAEQCNEAIADVFAKIYGVLSNQFCNETTKPACPYDFTLSDVGCHKLVKSDGGWNVAATTCSQLVPGAHLAFIGSEAEQLEINKIIKKTSVSDCFDNTYGYQYWIGGLRKRMKPFRWYFNATYVADTICYFNWDYSYPVKSDTQQCMFVQKTSTDYKWKHRECSDRSNPSCSVCEIDL